MATKHEMALGLTRDELEKIVHYDPETGRMVWLVDRTCGPNRRVHVRAGDAVGHVKSSGYFAFSLNYCILYVHRVAWFLVYGEWPSDRLDHINLDRGDNRIANLRPASDLQNRVNTRVRSKTGFKGVIKPKHANVYIAQISVDGKTRYLGTFKTPEMAHEAYMAAARKRYGEFARAR